MPRSAIPQVEQVPRHPTHMVMEHDTGTHGFDLQVCPRSRLPFALDGVLDKRQYTDTSCAFRGIAQEVLHDYVHIAEEVHLGTFGVVCG